VQWRGRVAHGVRKGGVTVATLAATFALEALNSAAVAVHIGRAEAPP
jgi:hypothetical protein